MKKLHEIVKPYLLIIFGGLFFLLYLNLLAGQDMVLVYGIVGVVIASYYLAVGILGIVIADKLEKAKKILDIVTISLYPVFMFTMNLLSIINNYNALAPTGWFLIIISMLVALALATFYVLARLMPNKLINRLAHLFAALFILVLLLNLLFDFVGNPYDLGDLSVVGFILSIVYVGIMFNSFKDLSIKEETKVEEEPAKEEEPQEEEEKQEESEEPAEEEKAAE